MTWATRQSRVMEPERILPPDMLEEVQVRAVRSFIFDDLEAKAGEVLVLPKHRASYLVFMGKVVYV
jgi:hypothetical protein